jgi:hypothetical protein
LSRRDGQVRRLVGRGDVAGDRAGQEGFRAHVKCEFLS